MTEPEIYPVPAAWAKKAWVDRAGYQKMYRQSIDDPESFWGEQGKRLNWIKPYTKVMNALMGGGHFLECALIAEACLAGAVDPVAEATLVMVLAFG